MLKLKKAEDLLLFLTLLFLPTQLGKHFWPDFSYIYSLKVDFLSPTIYFWDLLAVVLVLVWILQKSKINKWALNLWLFFMLTQFLSLLGTQNIGAGLVRFEQLLVSGLFGVYVASYDFNKLQEKIYLPLILGIAGESVIAITQFIKGATLGLWILGERTFSISTPAIAKFDFYGRQFLRPYATFPHPNVLAGYLVVVMVLLKRKSGWLTILPSISLFLTMSRTAIAVVLLILPFIFKRKWLIVVGILLLLLSPILLTRFLSIFNFDNLSLIRREELTASSLQLFFKNPFFGVGLNNFIPALANNLVTGPSRFLQPVHNIFLLTLAETGIVGLLGLLILMGYPMKKLSNVKSQLSNLLPWLIIIFLGLFDHYFLTLPQGYRLLFLVWGFSFSVLSSKSRN